MWEIRYTEVHKLCTSGFMLCYSVEKEKYCAYIPISKNHLKRSYRGDSMKKGLDDYSVEDWFLYK